MGFIGYEVFFKNKLPHLFIAFFFSRSHKLFIYFGFLIFLFFLLLFSLLFLLAPVPFNFLVVFSFLPTYSSPFFFLVVFSSLSFLFLFLSFLLLFLKMFFVIIFLDWFSCFFPCPFH